jgi:hypothetical protein
LLKIGFLIQSHQEEDDESFHDNEVEEENDNDDYENVKEGENDHDDYKNLLLFTRYFKCCPNVLFNCK